MDASAGKSYLATEAMTATPQKLQLMLIEAAIRTAERTRQAWRDEDHEKACDSLIQAQQVMSELLGALNPEVDANLTGRVASVYLFVFRRLTEAGVERSEEKLDDAVRILKIERETWQKVCQQPGGKMESEEQSAAASPFQSTGTPVVPADPDVAELPSGPVTAEEARSEGLSLEA